MIRRPPKNIYHLDYTEDLLFHHVFERQVQVTPNSVAVVFANECLTYEELNEKANSIASYLRRVGVKPDQPVAICVRRSFDLLVGILGILKAGAAYLPLDPSYPIHRLRFMLKDARVSVLLTHLSCEELFANSSCQIKFLDAHDYAKANKAVDDGVCLVTPNNLAYVIYTSGSTGKPKGVMIEHRSMTRRLLDLCHFYSLEENDICVHYRSYSYDASLEELLLPLLTGSRVVIAPSKKQVNLVETLVDLIRQHKITTINLMPSILPLFLDYVGANNKIKQIRSLRRVVAGGEPLNANVVKEFYKIFNIPLYHMYGPTEVTIDAIASKIEAFNGQKTIPIGKPLPNTKIYVLDKKLKLVEPGNVGELYLSGIGVSRGYLHRSALTAASFIKSPFTQNNNERLYKTGDLVRELPGGDIVFIGRIDNQVKVRGYRIEVGEVNACLQQIPEIKDSIVIVKGDNASNRYLVAYLICSDDFIVTEGGVRDFLSSRLPDYMLPSQYIMRDKFPTLPSGKIDCIALSQINRNIYSENNNMVAKNHDEAVIANIWSEILRIPCNNIDTNANFFNMGGTSLTAIQVVNSMNVQCNNRLNVVDIFNNPTISQLACLSCSKHRSSGRALDQVEDRCSYPLSFSQELIWFHQQIEPDTPFYNEPLIVNIHAHIDVEILRQSVNALVKRHELLRCRICVTHGIPYLVITDDRSIPIKFVDISDRDEESRSAESLRMATNMLRKPFRFDSEPLIRFLLVQLDKERFKLFISAYHCMTDGISMFHILIPELENTYFSMVESKTPDLALPKYRYRDYASWQRNLLLKEDYSAHKKYWKKKLSDLKESRFPFANYTGNISLRGKIKELLIPTFLVKGLKILSKQTGVTLFMTLLSVFVALIYRYTLQEDIAVGTVVAGRNISGLDNIFGNFLNTIILRNEVYGKSSFLRLLNCVKDAAIEAYKYQDLPFQEVLKLTKLPRRKNSYLPFQLAFIYEPESYESEHGWEVNQTEIHTGTSKFDLMFELDEKTTGVVGRVEYNTDIFSDYYIEQLINSYSIMLESLVVESDQIIDEIPLLRSSDKLMILDEWNNVAIQYNDNMSVCEVVANVAKKQPSKTALIFENTTLTYSELDSRANVVAEYLYNHGVSSKDAVSVCCERSIELIIVILGVLKVGGVYVPIKSDYPSDRISCLISDCGSKIIIADDDSHDKLKNIPTDSVVLVNIKNITNKSHKKSNISSARINGLNPAYIIYTSGSTGEPKGVIQTHRTLNNLIHWQSCQLNNKNIKRVACFASIGFDVCLQEIFYALFNGYELCIVPEAIRHSFHDTVEYIEKNRIDVLFLPTRMLEYLAESFLKYGTNIEYPKYIIVAGEQLEITSYIREMFSKYQNTVLINQYGPSETHVVASYRLDKNTNKWVGDQPIGRPIYNNYFYVLNEALQLMPVGTIGELYVSGDNLALGYANKNKLTKNKFISNPFSKSGKELMYKTGDLVKWTPDGILEFVDRSDDQIKIRGFMVELSEIKSVIMKYAGVIDCEVLADRVNKTDHIIAYVVFENNNKNDVRKIQELCRVKLPEYMVPKHFIALSKLPLTANGKIDRKALLDTSHINNNAKSKTTLGRKPHTSLQKRLAELWSKILQYTNLDISIDDDFFDLGGHSLSVLQLLSYLKDIFDIDLKFCEFPQLTTISKLEERIKNIFPVGVDDEKIDDVS